MDILKSSSTGWIERAGWDFGMTLGNLMDFQTDRTVALVKWVLEAVVIWCNGLVTLAVLNGLEKIGFCVLGMKMVQVWLSPQEGTPS